MKSAPSEKVHIIGGGLAGAEAAWQAAHLGASVILYEMRPVSATPAHQTSHLAELVCSNSLGSLDPTSAPGLLKEEMRRLSSLIIEAAEGASVPAGAALAVDRVAFANRITEAITTHPNITLLREEVKEIPDTGIIILATGPLTSDALADSIRRLTQSDQLYFFDAISPIIDADSIDDALVFPASRYGKGGDDYLNCPMNEAEYQAFYDALMSAERVIPKSFEQTPYFEGCLPIEVLAERGPQTPLFGPMKPVGLVDPRTGRTPYAVVQLRPENQFLSCYNMVGFQTRLKWPEQKRVFRMIPGLAQAEFLRLGSLHRNTFVNAPRILSESLQVRTRPGLFMAGQITGVEGYLESAAIGGLAGLNAVRLLKGEATLIPPKTTAHGALIQYLAHSHPAFFQPININFGLFPPLDEATLASHPQIDRKGRKAARHQRVVERALEDLTQWMAQSGISANTSG
jgi:methylenetetrahydrofolate--tRNA-(uracil-5-)-methyltransferase